MSYPEHSVGGESLNPSAKMQLVYSTVIANQALVLNAILFRFSCSFLILMTVFVFIFINLFGVIG